MLPPEGLIVSCYLHSMKSMEKRFIESIWEIECVKTLRVEGEENIRYAKRMCDISEKYIIGLIKEPNNLNTSKPYITPTVEYVKRVIDSGADMVAIDSRLYFELATSKNERISRIDDLKELYKAADMVMADIGIEEDAKIAWELGANIIATTFQPRAFSLANILVHKGMSINIEGGLKNGFDIQLAKDMGAKWYTIGRAIHDPPTIIRNLLGLNINGK